MAISYSKKDCGIVILSEGIYVKTGWWKQAGGGSMLQITLKAISLMV